MKSERITALVLLLVLFLNLLLLPVQAQVGDPIEITFGQPNIWSLEQAHYLLSQMRERSMRIKADELKDLDPNSAEASRINLVRQLFGLTGEFKQNPTIPNAVPATSPTPIPPVAAPFPSPVAEPSPLAGTILSTLLDKDFLRKLNSDSKLNATTRLDNHVQLQYEIIAKQLTLLRDEVGPDERLVFLELPQSIYASANDTKGKVVQTYWEIAGYSEYDRNADILESIKKLDDNLKILRGSLTSIEKVMNADKYRVYKSLKKQAKDTEKALEKAKKECAENCNEAARECADTCNGKECSEKCEKTKKECVASCDKNPITKGLNSNLITKKKELQDFLDASKDNKIIADTFDDAESEYQYRKDTIAYIEDELQKIQTSEPFEQASIEAKATIERIKQQGARSNNDIIQRVIDRLNYESSQFIKDNPSTTQAVKDYVNRKVRAVDIIPRQSSLNVNDIQETVKSSILGGAFSFLFGLGLRTNYQRQRDTFEQYLHQEIYASGFGKGESLFGWTFGPVPGTKRVASGVRTTYAVLVVPRQADALIMNARGCYFDRKNFQPQNVMRRNEDNSPYQNWRDDDSSECSEKKQYIIPVPNGGDARGFWLTSIDYAPVEKGQKVVASIKGRNFTSQVGVLVNGVPLQQVVELTRKLPSGDLANRDFCENDICGKYEVIDEEEITLVFKMPKDFEGTPEISIVGPGRAVSLSELKIRIKPHGSDVCERCNIKKDAPFMFGNKATEKLTVSELQVFPDGANTTAILTGTKFSRFEDIYVNGKILNKAANEQDFISSKQYRLAFDLKGRDSVTILVKQCLEKVIENGKEKLNEVDCQPNHKKELITTVVKTFPVKTDQFTITNVTALRYDGLKDEMFVRIEGTGFDSQPSTCKVNDGMAIMLLPSGCTVIPVSARELLVKVNHPEATVKLTLVNSAGAEISTIVARPPDIDELEP